METTIEFTNFTKQSNWVRGKCGEYIFDAKLFDECSEFGVAGGRVSKISIHGENGIIVNYDRGWDKRPTKEFKPTFKKILSFLENSPKRFI